MASSATKNKVKEEVEAFKAQMEEELKNKYDAKDTVLDEEFKGLNEQLKNTRDLMPKDEEMEKLADTYVRFVVSLLIPKVSMTV